LSLLARWAVSWLLVPKPRPANANVAARPMRIVLGDTSASAVAASKEFAARRAASAPTIIAPGSLRERIARSAQRQVFASGRQPAHACPLVAAEAADEERIERSITFEQQSVDFQSPKELIHV
jgi:hypothetical protein